MSALARICEQLDEEGHGDLAAILSLLSTGSRDELRVFHRIAARVMGGGRKQYGPLILSNDQRDFKREGADEAADLLWYAAIQEVLRGE